MAPKEFTQPEAQTFIATFVAGVLSGIGALLRSGDNVTLRNAIARSITSGILGASASGVWVVYPDASPITVIGLSCALATLGTDGIQMLVKNYSHK